MDIDAIISALNYSPDDAAQRAQAAHLLELIRYWGIRPGSRILEISCGQKGLSAILAHMAGDKGCVHSIDLSRSEMDETVDFGSDSFDCIVLSYSLWCLSGYDELVTLLRRASRWGKRLYIAQWDPRLRDSGQLAHLQAVTIRAICQSYHPNRKSNVRTLIYPQEIDYAILEGGWTLEHSESLSTDGLPDAALEVQAAQELCPRLIGCSDMPQPLKRLLFAQLSELDCCGCVSPLPVYCAKASRYTPKHFHNS